MSGLPAANGAATLRPGLVRGMGLAEAASANMLNMIGIGPFLTIPVIIKTMGGPQAMVGWFLGLILAVCDGLVWAELGAAMPGAGGPYVYLREAFNRRTWGRLLSFLFIWEIIFIAPLSAASAAVGFADYLQYLIPDLTSVGKKLVAASLCALVVGMLYRGIRSVGKMTVAMLAVVLLAVAWAILAGFQQFEAARAFDFPPNAFALTPPFFTALGAATLIAIFDYGGYNNICYIGSEVRNAEKTIPRSILLSILIVAVIYALLNLGIIGVIPWREAQESKSIASDLVQRVHGGVSGQAMAIFILFAAGAGLFALMLGYSRIPYAAAVDGMFFAPFARLHPVGLFPHVSLLVIGGLAMIACSFTLENIIKALIVIQILLQFLAQAVAVTAIRRYRRHIGLPFRMWLYPIPSVLAFFLWSYILFSSGTRFVLAGMAIVLVGVLAFLWLARRHATWPFGAVADGGPG